MRLLLFIPALAFSLVCQAQPFTHGELAWPDSARPRAGTGARSPDGGPGGSGFPDEFPIDTNTTYLISTGWVTKVIGYAGAETVTNADFSIIATAFTVGATNIAVSALARWHVPGNTHLHTIGIFPNSGSAPGLFPMFTATVAITNGAANDFVFTNLAHSFTLTNGFTYWIGDTEGAAGGGDTFLCGSAVEGVVCETTTAAGIVRGGHCPDSAGICTYFATTNLNIGPFSFIYSYTN